MSEPSTETPTLASLRAEAHRLIDAIARKPAAVKLLRDLLPLLEASAGYKSGRWQQRK